MARANRLANLRAAVQVEYRGDSSPSHSVHAQVIKPTTGNVMQAPYPVVGADIVANEIRILSANLMQVFQFFLSSYADLCFSCISA